jgi:hypothetical protein
LKLAITLVLWAGTIDRVEDGVATAEMVDSTGKIQIFEGPVESFPCKPKEQGEFWIVQYNTGLIEARCLTRREKNARKTNVNGGYHPYRANIRL